VESAEIFLSNLNAIANLVPIDVLYDGTMQPEGFKLFKQLGYAPLRDYIENENDECRIPSQEILGTYAISCVEAMIDTVSDPAQSNPDTVCTLMMVGHAVLSSCSCISCSVTGRLS
jgi:hypothetical protein